MVDPVRIAVVGAGAWGINHVRAMSRTKGAELVMVCDGAQAALDRAHAIAPGARLEGGIRNKAARGELRRGLPVGFVWGDQDGEVRFHPDQAVTGAVRTVFDRFTELGSARKVWLWFCSEGLSLPLRQGVHGEVRWVAPTSLLSKLAG